MSGWQRRAAGASGAIMLAVLGEAMPTAPAWAAAEPTDACTTTSGVIVAVDFGHWGGPLLRACGTTPTTGYTLLNQGGWRTTGTQHDGPGFICRIGYAGYQGGTEYPTPSQESCVLTPPASAYWAFWYANPGQNGWSYSPTGAMTIQPEAGSVELWTFGRTSLGGTSGSAVPTIAPADLRAENTGPATTGGRPAPAASAATAGPARQTGPAGGQLTPSGTVTAGAGGTASTAAPSRATVVNAPPVAAGTPVSHGAPTAAIIALVIVLVLAAVGIIAVLRRPRRDQ
jgi:hypothetical protein